MADNVECSSEDVQKYYSYHVSMNYIYVYKIFQF